MIEGTPGQPYGGTMSEFNTVEDNMRKRRKEATSLLGENQALCTITSFPRLVPVSACRVGILHLIPALDSGTLMLCGQLNMHLQQSHTPASANGGDQEDPGEDCLAPWEGPKAPGTAEHRIHIPRLGEGATLIPEGRR